MTSDAHRFASEPAAPNCAPVRLRMVEHPGRDHLDGGWWRRSRDLAVELADLVDHFPARFGRIVHAQVWPLDWDRVPRRVGVCGGCISVESLPAEDVHLVQLTTSARTVLRVLVVPPDFTADQGDEALLAAATSGNAHSASDLLDEVTDHPDADPLDYWRDSGESWWEPHPVPPSFRRPR